MEGGAGRVWGGWLGEKGGGVRFVVGREGWGGGGVQIGDPRDRVIAVVLEFKGNSSRSQGQQPARPPVNPSLTSRR